MKSFALVLALALAACGSPVPSAISNPAAPQIAHPATTVGICGETTKCRTFTASVSIPLATFKKLPPTVSSAYMPQNLYFAFDTKAINNVYAAWITQDMLGAQEGTVCSQYSATVMCTVAGFLPENPAEYATLTTSLYKSYPYDAYETNIEKNVRPSQGVVVAFSKPRKP